MRNRWSFFLLVPLSACGSAPSASSSAAEPAALSPAERATSPDRDEPRPEGIRELASGRGTLVISEVEASRFYQVHGFFAPDGYYTLTPAEAAAAIDALDPAVAALPGNVDDASGYYRHVLGVVVEGRRSAFVAGFCRADEWREPVSVEDGGECYFEGHFDLDAGSFRDLRFHGEA
ncbi:MAG: hypothetical protein AAF938_07545 [Myxococcota bacterium]